MLKYKRVSLKLSGEALGGDETVDFTKVGAVARQVAALHALGVQAGITLGGGNIWRGRSSGDMERNRADHMGMLATVINSLALQDALEHLGVPSVVLTSVDMPRIADGYSSRAARAALAAGQAVIFAGGSGLPFVSTDTAAALKAAEIGADAMLLAKNVDAVYSADPNVDPNAKRYSHLTYDEVIEQNLQATDMTAIALCRERNIPIVAFAMADAQNILRVVQGESVGTLIDGIRA
ncbi:MAG: UMP kinase [Christensenellaceae bacterium]|jgi:uridylate kinase|nr:UMP kinase [Christensenellaceae bacterium]